MRAAPRTSSRRHRRRVGTTPSRASSSRLTARSASRSPNHDPPYPPIEPSPAMTRWHGMTARSGSDRPHRRPHGRPRVDRSPGRAGRSWSPRPTGFARTPSRTRRSQAVSPSSANGTSTSASGSRREVGLDGVGHRRRRRSTDGLARAIGGDSPSRRRTEPANASVVVSTSSATTPSASAARWTGPQGASTAATPITRSSPRPHRAPRDRLSGRRDRATPSVAPGQRAA